MKKIIYSVAVVLMFLLIGTAAEAQNISGVKSRLAVGENSVTVIEQSDAASAVRAVEQRPKRTKVNGYTILLLSDNSHVARENAVRQRSCSRRASPVLRLRCTIRALRSMLLRAAI